MHSDSIDVVACVFAVVRNFRIASFPDIGESPQVSIHFMYHLEALVFHLCPCDLRENNLEVQFERLPSREESDVEPFSMKEQPFSKYPKKANLPEPSSNLR